MAVALANTWTTDTPSALGEYWLPAGVAPAELVRVVDLGMGWWEVQFFGQFLPTPLSRIHGARWHGPLNPPPLSGANS